MNPNFIISPKTLTLITNIQLYSHIVVNPFKFRSFAIDNNY